MQSIIIYGPQGSGKTTVAKKLAKKHKMKVSNDDVFSKKTGYIYTSNLDPKKLIREYCSNFNLIEVEQAKRLAK